MHTRIAADVNWCRFNMVWRKIIYAATQCFCIYCLTKIIVIGVCRSFTSNSIWWVRIYIRMFNYMGSRFLLVRKASSVKLTNLYFGRNRKLRHWVPIVDSLSQKDYHKKKKKKKRIITKPSLIIFLMKNLII